MRDFVVMDGFEHGPWASASIKIVLFSHRCCRDHVVSLPLVREGLRVMVAQAFQNWEELLR
jgi:hypothetical protein